MRIHRFFVEFPLVREGTLTVPDTALLHQWKSVFRLREGDPVILFDNSGDEYVARITRIGKKEGAVEILDRHTCSVPIPREVLMCVSVAKKDKFEWVVEKGTELGVTRFIPILSDRTEKKNVSLERLKKIAKEATEQSERCTLPEIDPVTPLTEAIDSISNTSKSRMRVVALDREAADHIRGLQETNDPIAVFIGPEGGWSDNERTLFEKRDVQKVLLGDTVLKTETAAVAAASFLLLSPSVR